MILHRLKWKSSKISNAVGAVVDIRNLKSTLLLIIINIVTVVVFSSYIAYDNY